MDLILWRHAEAQEPEGAMTDLDRPLTRRGEKQAARMAAWLDRQLPDGTRILSSSALRTEETARALGRRFKSMDGLRPGASAEQLLQVAGWPLSKTPVLVVGHQPTLGQTAAQLLGLPGGECAIKKGAIWWLRSRERDGEDQTVLIAVLTAELV